MAEQMELFGVDTGWFHIFRSMIDSGDCAKLGPYAVVVYLVIKAHTNLETGKTFPGVQTIAKKAGISEKQVKRSLVTLADMGYLVKHRQGRRNVYTLHERFPVTDSAGKAVATVTCPYVPLQMQALQGRIKNMLQAGAIAEGQTAHVSLTVQVIANTVQINTGGGTQVNNCPV